MILSSAVIRMNYNKAVQQANRLDDLARQLMNLANHNLDGTLSNINRAWDGESANLFLQKGLKAKDDMIKTARSIQNTANAIRKAAEIVRQSDMRAREIALNRLSGGGSR